VYEYDFQDGVSEIEKGTYGTGALGRYVEKGQLFVSNWHAFTGMCHMPY
jgi:hypothetical protein